MDKSIKMEGMSNMSKYSKYIQIPANILLLLAIAFFALHYSGKEYQVKHILENLIP